MGFAITISFILHFISFFIIILLWMRLSNANEQFKQQEDMQKEIEDVFSAYMMEMKDENEKLLQSLQKGAPAKNISSAKSLEDTSNTEKANLKPSNKAVSRIYHLNQQQTDKPQPPPSPEEKDLFDAPISKSNEQFVQSMASRAFQLEKDGYTIDEIAKKLNKGKTEIELLLKFRRES